jgi:hypothetical protein
MALALNQPIMRVYGAIEQVIADEHMQHSDSRSGRYAQVSDDESRLEAQKILKDCKVFR